MRTINVIKVKLHPLTALQAQFTRFTSLREALFTCIWKRRQRQQTESVRKSIGNNILTEKSDRTTSLKAAPNGHSNSKNDAGAENKVPAFSRSFLSQSKQQARKRKPVLPDVPREGPATATHAKISALHLVTPSAGSAPCPRCPSRTKLWLCFLPRCLVGNRYALPLRSRVAFGWEPTGKPGWGLGTSSTSGHLLPVGAAQPRSQPGRHNGQDPRQICRGRKLLFVDRKIRTGYL